MFKRIIPFHIVSLLSPASSSSSQSKGRIDRSKVILGTNCFRGCFGNCPPLLDCILCGSLKLFKVFWISAYFKYSHRRINAPNTYKMFCGRDTNFAVTYVLCGETNYYFFIWWRPTPLKVSLREYKIIMYIYGVVKCKLWNVCGSVAALQSGSLTH